MLSHLLKAWMYTVWRLSEAADRVVVTVLADEGYTGIAWNIGAAFTHQITEGFWEERGSKHTWGRYYSKRVKLMSFMNRLVEDILFRKWIRCAAAVHTSYGYEEQSWTHSSWTTVKSLFPVFYAPNDHTDALCSWHNTKTYTQQEVGACKLQTESECCIFTNMHTWHAHLLLLGTHRYEQYTPKQGPGEGCFHDLFVTFGGSTVSLQQCCDVERHLRDGAKGGIHHRTHCKVTLCRNAVEKNTQSPIKHENSWGIRGSILHHPAYLAIPMPI